MAGGLIASSAMNRIQEEDIENGQVKACLT
jgi:hypothetical protein